MADNGEIRQAWLLDLFRLHANGELSEAQVLKALNGAKRYVPAEDFTAVLQTLGASITKEEVSRYLDWVRLMDEDIDESWLVQDVWPMGRQVHVHALRKTGKSLLFQWMAACLSIGRDPFTGAVQQRKRVLYLDPESTRSDIRQRLLDDMSFKPQELDHLYYGLHPPMAKLDTEQGGSTLMQWVAQDQIECVVIDGFPRMVQGEENSSDTYRNFYMHTGYRLKAANVPYARADNEGHLEGRSRGSSAKADDVDIVWQLREGQDGLQLVRKASRIADVPELVAIYKREDPLRFERGAQMWLAGTNAKADELDALNAPIDITQRQAKALFKQAGLVAGTTAVLQCAINYRKAKGGW